MLYNLLECNLSILFLHVWMIDSLIKHEEPSKRGELYWGLVTQDQSPPQVLSHEVSNGFLTGSEIGMFLAAQFLAG